MHAIERIEWAIMERLNERWQLHSTGYTANNISQETKDLAKRNPDRVYGQAHLTFRLEKVEITAKVVQPGVKVEMSDEVVVMDRS